MKLYQAVASGGSIPEAGGSVCSGGMRSTQAGEKPRDIGENEAKEKSVETVQEVVHDAFGQCIKK
eukprot:13487881-Alexandrium_andersonii.AAC.1